MYPLPPKLLAVQFNRRPLAPDTPRRRISHIIHQTRRPAPQNKYPLRPSRPLYLPPDYLPDVGPVLGNLEVSRQADLVRVAVSHAGRGGVLQVGRRRGDGADFLEVGVHCEVDVNGSG